MDAPWSASLRNATYIATVAENRWIPFTPHPKQTRFLWLVDVKEIFYGGAAGGAKDLSLHTLIPTPNGWTTMGEIKVGEELFDKDGKVCRVVAKSEIINNPTFRMEFDSGDVIIAGEGHLWNTMTEVERNAFFRCTDEFRQARRESRPSRAVAVSQKPWVSTTVTRLNEEREYDYKDQPTGTVRNTREIFDTKIVRQSRINHSIDATGALDLSVKNLPIEPYLFGLWLGDGVSCAGSIGMMDDDLDEVLSHVRRPILARHPQPKGHKKPYSSVTFAGLRTLLRKIGVFGNKHIPSMYLRASIEQRMELLRGLLDTDGCCTKRGDIELGLSNRRLAEDALELVKSLGIKATMRTHRLSQENPNHADSHRIKFVAEFEAFKLQRKLVRQKRSGLRQTTRRHYIISVTEVPTVPTQCIAVDSDSHTFLVGRSMIPTHNSIGLLMAALQFVDNPNYSALIIRRTFKQLSKAGALMDVARQWLGGTAAKWNEEKSKWTFPSGSTLEFGYLDSIKDRENFQSAAYNYIAFDELTQFREDDYRYLFSRLRKVEESTIPSRMRSASNPGSLGHAWTKKRFNTEHPADPKDDLKPMERVFIPATLDDNPSLNKKDYLESLAMLPMRERKQLECGDWSDYTGAWWRPNQWPRWIDLGDAVSIPGAPHRKIYLWRDIPNFVGIDWATSEKKTANWTSFVCGGLTPCHHLLIRGMFVDQINLEDNPEYLAQFCRIWRPAGVVGEDDTLSKTMVLACRRLPDIPEIQMIPIASKSKLVRWTSGIVQAENHRVLLPALKDGEIDSPEWLERFKDQLQAVTGNDDPEDDIADAFGVLCRKIDGMRGIDTSDDDFPEVFDPGKQVW